MPARLRTLLPFAALAVTAVLVAGCGSTTSETTAVTQPSAEQALPTSAPAPTQAATDQTTGDQTAGDQTTGDEASGNQGEGGEREGGEGGEGGDDGAGQGTQPTPPPSAGTTTAYTMTDIAQHSSTTDCWAAIDGGVFDLTQWIPMHPGGPEVVSAMCGGDGSAAFDSRHGGQGEPAQVLAYFQVGVLGS